MMSPTAAGDRIADTSAVFANAIPGSAANGVSVDDGGGTISGPVGGVATAVAVLARCPASRSACVSTYVAVARTVWPGSSTPSAAGHEYVSPDSPGSGSA